MLDGGRLSFSRIFCACDDTLASRAGILSQLVIERSPSLMWKVFFPCGWLTVSFSILVNEKSTTRGVRGIGWSSENFAKFCGSLGRRMFDFDALSGRIARKVRQSWMSTSSMFSRIKSSSSSLHTKYSETDFFVQAIFFREFIRSVISGLRPRARDQRLTLTRSLIQKTLAN